VQGNPQMRVFVQTVLAMVDDNPACLRTQGHRDLAQDTGPRAAGRDAQADMTAPDAASPAFEPPGPRPDQRRKRGGQRQIPADDIDIAQYFLPSAPRPCPP